MPAYKVDELFNLSETIAEPLLSTAEYGWQALGAIREFILSLGPTLPAEFYNNPSENVWIAKDARIAPSASITGPCIIDAGAEVRHCAFIRGDAIVGKNAVVGNSTELKNCILFNGVQVPHFNYIGDSILGHRAHFGAGAITSNVKSDHGLVTVHTPGGDIPTDRKKFGALVGDFAEIGCNAVLNPGTILGRGSMVYPTSCVRGQLPHSSICKADGAVTAKR